VPVGIEVTVSSVSADAAVTNATVRVSGDMLFSVSCTQANPSVCWIPAPAGRYTLDVAAPGFQNAQRSVTVQGGTGECGCPWVTKTEVVEVSLLPS
jgi:hypothetical protein